ncbi:hypothetical protein NC653_020960 [Populus alba x Populus x berolinensis]|uniref:Plant heme peroxidase family profile domain-containing protein n=1 Tax=Populus alba x Populus x berolinensis TaxID=444605 RepID=A0AAD6MLR2_9ROSI|nr:hypothetical protein NC653_020959 [Populus alba x Populus x berolinensis]KAJ6987874.1 hypothetical protein NC653_020960 [Populus alba x Populus x berolinensis]
MGDVLTELPPSSRFFQEDLDNFATSSPPLSCPSLLLSNLKPDKPLHPSLLIIALSSPSLYVFHHISSKTLIGSLILPEIPFSANSIGPSLGDKSCNIYALNDADNLTLVVSVQCSVSAERSIAVAKLLIGDQIIPERVLILDSVQNQNFRGRLAPDEINVFKLETSAERKGLSDDGCGGSSLLKGLDYFPSGSVLDGLAAALLARCQMRKIRGTLCVSWPQHGVSVVAMVKSLLQRNVLHGFDLSSIGDSKDESSRKAKGATMAFPLQEIKLPILPFSMLIIISILGRSLHASDPPLTLDYYAPTCPSVFEIVKKEMECEVISDPRSAALIVRLHFHDCFVQIFSPLQQEMQSFWLVDHIGMFLLEEKILKLQVSSSQHQIFQQQMRVCYLSLPSFFTRAFLLGHTPLAWHTVQISGRGFTGTLKQLRIEVQCLRHILTT